MAMTNPVHPGAIVREECLIPLSLSVTEGAKRLGVGRQTLSNLVNEKPLFQPKWLTGSQKHSAQHPRRGWACKWPSTSRSPATSKRPSRSTESTPPRTADTSPLPSRPCRLTKRPDTVGEPQLNRPSGQVLDNGREPRHGPYHWHCWLPPVRQGRAR